MKILIVPCVLFVALIAVALGQSPTSSRSPIPCSDVKDASNPRDVVLIGEVHVGTLADALKNYPALAAKLKAVADKFAKDKEAKLLEVSKTNAPRARQKMEEFIASGIPISKKTQDAILAALPPPMRPQPTPTASPDDGL